MGFDDLDEAISDQDGDEATRNVSPDIAHQENSNDMAVNQEQSNESARDDTTEGSSTSPLNHPAFPFEDSKQDAIYPTAETLDEFNDTLDFEVKRRLRDEGLRDIPKREYHEALLQLAIEKPERLAELVIENRR